MDKCPKCKRNSLTKRPDGRIIKDTLNTPVMIGSEYTVYCLNTDCNHVVTNFIEYKKIETPWGIFKKIFGF